MCACGSGVGGSRYLLSDVHGSLNGTEDDASNSEPRSSCRSSRSGACISRYVLLFFAVKFGVSGGILGFGNADGAFDGSRDGTGGTGFEGRSAGPGIFDRGKKTGGYRKSMSVK